ncbi:MAG TPA: hypothetical protein PKC39_14505 [Ferruginibacter sp.]|nr:hypothetical protein [Ferruginibacter sp.]HMP22167.1 hypothetical protein [Ferruginibacter sp.]
MALNKDILGEALHAIRQDFNEKSIEELLQMYNTMEAARLAYSKKEAEVIINHFKNNAVVPGTGLVAPNGAVSGQASII